MRITVSRSSSISTTARRPSASRCSERAQPSARPEANSVGPEVGERSLRPFADEVSLQLGGTGHDREEEPPHRRTRIDGLTAEVDEVERDAAIVPVADHAEAIGAVAKHAVQLVGDDGNDASAAHEVENATPTLARRERLSGADACVDDDLCQVQSSHDAICTYCCLLRVQADATRCLLLGGDPHVPDDPLLLSLRHHARPSPCRVNETTITVPISGRRKECDAEVHGRS